ncbi:hypothetical protein VPH219E481_0003 [Vibrio phage 219E48-1]|nr:hypothetical protein PODOV021v1_p0081 [Vibrio phage 219E41.2]QZI91052.1 hypothetical protein PODOV032v1_p0047 [Vibrio phage 219E41.1]QZI91131.1 hypothetical protein PODOV060v1_p0037 [Vibrio phage 234P8]QZI91576.1 hypothetical protein PODOV087v1_p0071 [Vibrio phage 431E45.1]QZI91640.1 hypothetical protein PODOV086v1_p0056 [Vibrio phage 431E46.1]QZI91673.1 hypothetical protein PODOV088v1_p0012 [Vibrio phage 431E48.2]
MKQNQSFIDYSCLSQDAYDAEMKHEAMCMEMNNVVGEFICKTYPGYPWGVQTDIRNGIINIFLNIGNAGRAPYGVTIKLESQMQLVLKKCLHFSGELLERYGLRRGKMDANEFGALMETADFAGRIKIDESK